MPTEIFSGKGQKINKEKDTRRKHPRLENKSLLCRKRRLPGWRNPGAKWAEQVEPHSLT